MRSVISPTWLLMNTFRFRIETSRPCVYNNPIAIVTTWQNRSSTGSLVFDLYHDEAILV